jgi:hypothetical protein
MICEELEDYKIEFNEHKKRPGVRSRPSFFILKID